MKFMRETGLLFPQWTNQDREHPLEETDYLTLGKEGSTFLGNVIYLVNVMRKIS